MSDVERRQLLKWLGITGIAATGAVGASYTLKEMNTSAEDVGFEGPTLSEAINDLGDMPNQPIVVLNTLSFVSDRIDFELNDTEFLDRIVAEPVMVAESDRIKLIGSPSSINEVSQQIRDGVGIDNSISVETETDEDNITFSGSSVAGGFVVQAVVRNKGEIWITRGATKSDLETAASEWAV